MARFHFVLAIASLAVGHSGAQAPPSLQPPQDTPRAPTETLVVLGTVAPVPLAESSRSVDILPVQPNLLSVQTPLDLLRSDSSAFIEQRGAGGAQSDIVLRGGGFAQTLVLVNGFRINDAQTAHHNLDLPIPLDAMDSVQILEGAGSTLHGVDALSGVVDFVTAAPAHSSVLLRAGAGSFGSNEESFLGGIARNTWSARATGTRNFSTGFIPDRDYRNEDASFESWAGSRLGVTDLLFAASDRSFGADQFYGDFPSWERTKSWFASARQEIGSATTAAFGYRRHSDDFVLIRSNPSIYENNHVDSSWQASLRHNFSLTPDSLLLAGLEADGDSISSNNLGVHARNRGAGYIDVDLRPARGRWNLSAGVRGEIFSGNIEPIFAPQLAGSLRLPHQLKLRVSAGYGFRIPTYTDLYYSDPSTVGNANLKPESAWSADGGVDWSPSQKIIISATGFYSRQHNAIDYVRPSPADKWYAANLSGLRFAGVESSATWVPAKSQRVVIAWTSLNGAQRALNGLQSEYVFNYPVNNVRATWDASIRQSWLVHNSVQMAQRYQQTAYPVWNMACSRKSGRLRPYLRFDNLSNTGYQEINNVAMPGRSVTGGLAILIGRE
ncbi:MAG: TonB-dependent receptor [Acidobacteria bacterium]|nr:TonB-dependent receptor [Acidobacteriota bacterium]